MRKIRKCKKNTVLLIFIMIFICVISLYFIGKIIFWEENTSKSPYDEIFVDENNSIALKSLNLSKLQSEILIYISEWKEVYDLLYINLYLNSDLEISTVVFVYQLNDIDNYIGRLEVKCIDEGENWEIMKAQSLYYYDEDKAQNEREVQLEDSFLIEKIQAVVEYIASKEKPRMDIYLIKIKDNNIDIDAHNLENEESQNNWREECLVYQNEDNVFIKSKTDH